MRKTPALYFAVACALAVSLPAYAQPEGIGAEADFALFCGGIFASITAFDISQEDKDLAQAKSQVAFTQAAAALEADGVPDNAYAGLLEQYVEEAMAVLVSDDGEGRYTADECNALVGG